MFFLFFVGSLIAVYFAWKRFKGVVGRDEYKGSVFGQPEWMKKTGAREGGGGDKFAASSHRYRRVESEPEGPGLGLGPVPGSESESGEQSLLFILPRVDGDSAAALNSVLGMTAFDARSVAAVPGVARVVRVVEQAALAQKQAMALSRAGLRAAAITRAQLAGMSSSQKNIVSWRANGSLSLETADGLLIETARTPLTAVRRVYFTEITTKRAAASGTKRMYAVEAVAVAAFGVGAGSAVKWASAAGDMGPAASTHAESNYFLALYFAGSTEPYFVDPASVKTEAGLGSASLGLERELHGLIPRDRWMVVRNLPGEAYLGGEGVEANLLVTHALESGLVS